MSNTEIWGSWYTGDKKQLICTLHGIEPDESIAEDVLRLLETWGPICEQRHSSKAESPATSQQQPQ